MQIPFQSKLSFRVHAHPWEREYFLIPWVAAEYKIVSVGVLASERAQLPFMLHISSKKILLQVIQTVSMNDSQKVLNMGLVNAARHSI